MSAAAELRQVTLADRERVFAFLHLGYGELGAYKAPERWNWQYVGNPFVTEEKLPVWVAEKGDEIVGIMAAAPVRLQVGESEHDGAWAVDLVVLPTCRGEGIGGRLHQAEVEHFPMLMKLTMADATRRMAERTGCVNLGVVNQYSRWVRLNGDAVRRFLLTKTSWRPRANRIARICCGLFLDRLFALAMNPALALRDVVRAAPPAPEGVAIEEVAEFGAGVDELWEATRGNWGVISRRDARFLNWRFRGYPRLEYHRFEARRDGRITGYVVLRRPQPEELEVGILVDLYAAPDDEPTLRALVGHTLRFFGRSVVAIEAATTIPEYQRVLERHGFFVSKRENPTCVCDDATRPDVERLKDRWFLSKADHDWDQLHPAPPRRGE